MLPKRNWKLREYFVTLSRFYKFIILMYFADTDDRRLLYHLTKFRLLLCWSSGGHHGTLTFSPHSEWSLNMAWRGRPSHLWRCSGHWVNEKRCWTQGCLWIPPRHLHHNRRLIPLHWPAWQTWHCPHQSFTDQCIAPTFSSAIIIGSRHIWIPIGKPSLRKFWCLLLERCRTILFCQKTWLYWLFFSLTRTINSV